MPDNSSNSNDAKVVDTSPRPLLAALVGFVVISIGFIIAVGLYASKQMFDSKWVYEPAQFATAADASKGCPIPLPPEAVNIRVAMWRHFVAVGDYVRFEAPVEVCLQHAATIVPDEPLKPINEERLSEDHNPEPKVFRDLSWFDLSSAKNVVSAGGVGSHRPAVWVDQERGVFYYRLTD